MHIETTFWSKDVFVFDELFFVRGQGNEFTTMDRVELTDPPGGCTVFQANRRPGSERHPDIESWIEEVLQDAELLETEQRLGQLIETRRDPALSLNARVALVENWNSQMTAESQRMAKLLLERYPYPASDI